MTKVFISSTSADLQSYRLRAIKVCNILGLQPIAMEFFGTRNKKPVDLIQELVSESDIYLGIFAHRYGYIPEDETRSMTHIEFDTATSLGIPRLCFLVDPVYPWDISNIDFKYKDQLDALKAEIDKDLTRSTFTTEDDLQAKILQALVQVAETKSNPESNSRIFFTTNIPATSAIGRDQDVNAIVSKFIPRENAVSPIVVTGWPGVGKTTLVSLLAFNPLVQSTFPNGVLRIEVGETPDTIHILRQLARLLNLETSAHRTDELTYIVSTHLTKSRYLIILDDVWNHIHALPLIEATKVTQILITTRFQDVAESLIANPAQQKYHLDVLSDEGAMQLLESITYDFVTEMLEFATQLIEDIEHLPLAIIVAGKLLRQRMKFGNDAVIEILDAIREGRILQEKSPPDRYQRELGDIPTVQFLIGQSVNYLNEDEQIAFASLGAFAPKPARFDLNALNAIWLTKNPADMAQRLLNRGLLEFVPELNRYQMHALLVQYARRMLDGEGE